jgi:hypothetical protein
VNEPLGGPPAVARVRFRRNAAVPPLTLTDPWALMVTASFAACALTLAAPAAT